MKNVKNYIKRGLIDEEKFTTKSKPEDLFELVRKENIDELIQDLPVKRLHYVASNGCSLFLREAIEKMDTELFNIYLKYHFSICEREDLVGFTSNSLDILEYIGD